MKLVINKFGPIKNTEIDIKYINVFIGKSATGKSLIAKLIYLFLDIFDALYRKTRPDMAEADKGALEYFIKNNLKRNFEDLFEENYKDYNVIFYYNDEAYLSIESDKKIIFKYSDNIKERLFNDPYIDLSEAYSFLKKELKIPSVRYFPAGRNFTTILADNPFVLRETLNSVDKTIVDFGQIFHFHKKMYGRGNKTFENIKENKKKIQDIFKALLKGNYRYLNDEDRFYYNKSEYLPLNQISSGQQELLPALIVLWSILQYPKNYFIIFEEPEAHIFPTDQKLLIELLVLITNMKKSKLLITTHSPYTLSVLNNLIEAQNTVLEKPHKKEDINKIVDESLWINFDNVTALELSKNKKPKSILNKGNRLIDANKIDSASDIIAEEYDKLLDIQFEDK